jgi:hypothetical protein
MIMKRLYLALVFLGLLCIVGCSSSQDLVGLWVAEGLQFGEMTLDLNGDNTGTITYDLTDPLEMTWSVEDDQLCFSFDDESGDCMEYAVEGDQMTLDIGGDGISTRFTRWPGD